MADRIIYESDEVAVERYSSMFLLACVEIRSKKGAGHVAMPLTEWEALEGAIRTGAARATPLADKGG